MNDLDRELTGRLAALGNQGLFRELRRVGSGQGVRIELNGKSFLNFSSNDYLGLANDARLKAAAGAAIERFGAGAGASRLICGSLPPHDELDAELATFKGTEAALSFASGYAASFGTICSLLNKQDVVILDKLVHASIVDAARLSGAKLRVFAHNDLDQLAGVLAWSRNSRPEAGGQVLVVTESVFSMDGDQAPLREIVELKERYGAWLMVDEAHATGLYGARRRGLAEQLGVADRVEIQMGTLGKALGAAGGYVCGSRVLVDYLVNRARSFIFSTAPVPAAAAAALAGVRVVQSPDGEARRQQLWQNVAALTGPSCQASRPASAILPIIIGAETKAVAAASALRERGIFIPAVRYPSVARGQARLRLTVSAAHSPADLDELSGALHSLSLRLTASAAHYPDASPCPA